MGLGPALYRGPGGDAGTTGGAPAPPEALRGPAGPVASAGGAERQAAAAADWEGRGEEPGP
ncbi:MAG: hypothetical protein DIU69_09120 [Bacillota bacterium]|nr:MAG: hypothetical protein DIU69_09120 [Bacillota bacterium]